MSDAPTGPFTYGGRLVDLGDLGLCGHENERHASNYLGNTHGGMIQINGQWYIFYHRQTNRSSYARQACAEKLERREDGGFYQAEVTSCGLNQGTLKGLGTYEARIGCNLWSAEGTGRYDGRLPKKRLRKHPFFTQSGKDRENNGDQYIANMRNGAVAGFKYFQMGEANQIKIRIRVTGKGKMQVSDSADFRRVCADININKKNRKWHTCCGRLHIGCGKKALFFRFVGQGAIDFRSFKLVKVVDTSIQE